MSKWVPWNEPQPYDRLDDTFEMNSNRHNHLLEAEFWRIQYLGDDEPEPVNRFRPSDIDDALADELAEMYREFALDVRDQQQAGVPW